MNLIYNCYIIKITKHTHWIGGMYTIYHYVFKIIGWLVAYTLHRISKLERFLILISLNTVSFNCRKIHYRVLLVINVFTSHLDSLDAGQKIIIVANLKVLQRTKSNLLNCTNVAWRVRNFKIISHVYTQCMLKNRPD